MFPSPRCWPLRSVVRVSALTAALLLPTGMLAGCGQLLEDLPGSDAASSAAEDSSPVILIFDASSSMLYTDAGGTRLAAAKRASNELINGLSEQTPLSLITFGDTVPQSVGDGSAEGLERACADVTTRLDLGEGNSDAADSIVDGIQALGYTPLGASLDAASRQLSDSDMKATIILLSDGEDTCGGVDPVAAAADIRSSHPNVTINTVGFKTSNQQLRDIAEAGGGTFLTADNISQLIGRLEAARSARGARSQLSDTGVYGVSVGTKHADIRGRFADFPKLKGAKKENGQLLVEWRDCIWLFTDDGVLVGIRVASDVSTIDGLKSGSAISEANDLFGEPVFRGRLDGNRWEAYYSATGDLNWHIVYTSDDNGRSGSIVTIVLCRCQPPAGSDSDSADANPARPAHPAHPKPADPKSAAGSRDDEGHTVITFDSIGSYKLGDDASVLAADGGTSREVFGEAGATACTSWDIKLKDGTEAEIYTRDGKILSGPFSDTLAGQPSPSSWVTDRGISPGDSAAKLKAAYPNLQNTSQVSQFGGSHTVWATNDDGHTIVFYLRSDSTQPGPMPDDAKVLNMWTTTFSGDFNRSASFMAGC